MKLAPLLICFLYALTSHIAASPTNDNRHGNPQSAASKRIKKWQKEYNEYVEATVETHNTGCTSKNIVYRQEWGSLSPQAREDYIKAVMCLQKLPPLSSKSAVPGARSRYDDFSATHIVQTPYVHFSGLFFHFHRYLVWLYEKALQDECGYKGTQPYWDWTLSWQDPRNSTVFDGSPTSMGSNGEPIPHGPTNISAFGLSLTIAPATGGGCIYSGPFVDYTVNLGPVAYTPKGGDGGLAYNPRCLSRDISLVWANNTKPTDITALIDTSTDLGSFDTNLEAIGGVHAGGHFAMGGLGLDAYASAGDPAFWLHHAQVDRVWALWQNLRPKSRTSQVYGTGTAFNEPPSPNVTLTTSVDFGILAPKQKISRLISTIQGPFCYAYI